MKTIKILKKIRDASSLKIHMSLIQDNECIVFMLFPDLFCYGLD